MKENKSSSNLITYHSFSFSAVFLTQIHLIVSALASVIAN